MAIEVARTRVLHKPWGIADPRPWSDAAHTGLLTGELCYERSCAAASEPALLLKILMTSQPLSIQVHPDNAFAQSIGQPHGKTEAWYVIESQPVAAVGLGLRHSVTPRQLRQAIDDGSIADLVAWRTVSVGETIFVQAGTIHAIGPGVVIAEIQQRSDATFRLFDYGRNRDLHIAQAIAVASPAPADTQAPPHHLDCGRTLLASNPYFVFERLELEPDGVWNLDASMETWILILSGSARAGAFDVVKGGVVFAQGERIELRPGEAGVVCLVAYTGQGGPIHRFLVRGGTLHAKAPWRRNDSTLLAAPIGADL
jgi:mannose-6-phosphate isomerase